MTAKTSDQPAEYPNLAAALAAFQRALPSVEKGAKGQVRGKSDYRYADLSDLNGVVLPKLGEFGLSFSAKPTLNESGRFVLAYSLRHESGQEDTGEYPLPDNVSPQDMGSAQTYARRYVLQAMTGVAPDGQDDDGGAATRAYSHRGQNGQQRQNAPQGDRQAPPVESAPSPAESARAALRAACDRNGWDGKAVAEEFGKRYDGADLRTEGNASRITAFTKLLPDVFAPASNGAAQ